MYTNTALLNLNSWSDLGRTDARHLTDGLAERSRIFICNNNSKKLSTDLSVYRFQDPKYWGAYDHLFLSLACRLFEGLPLIFCRLL